MKSQTRIALSVASGGYLATTGLLFGDLPMPGFNLLLATTAVPMVWLIWVFARFSAHQHANRWARDIAKVHGGRERVSR